MEKIWLKIIKNKTNPIYWPIILILWIASILFRRGLWIHNLRSLGAVKTKAPVISVGNLTVGGSGKTPVTMEIARHFIQQGLKTAIVSSGYGRKSKEDFIGVGSDLQNMEAIKIGDEPKMMAELLPSALFSISRSKSRATSKVDIEYSPDIIIVDDGFQLRKLHRDFDLLVADLETDLRRESIFPLGRRREPLSALKRANGLAVTKGNSKTVDDNYMSWLEGKFKNRPSTMAAYHNDEIVSNSEHIPVDRIRNSRTYFFAGIGNSLAFEKHIKATFPNIVYLRLFPDHFRYRQSDIKGIRKDLKSVKSPIRPLDGQESPEYIITTFKDYVKVRDFDFGLPLYYLNLRLELSPAAGKLFAELDKILEKR